MHSSERQKSRFLNVKELGFFVEGGLTYKLIVARYKKRKRSMFGFKWYKKERQTEQAKSELTSKREN